MIRGSLASHVSSAEWRHQVPEIVRFVSNKLLLLVSFLVRVMEIRSTEIASTADDPSSHEGYTLMVMAIG